MRHVIVFILIILTCSIKANSQVVLTIEKVKISDVFVHIQPNIIDEDDEEGPYVQLYYCISNETDQVVKLMPKKSKMYLNFFMKDQSYTKTIFPIPLTDKDSLLLKPHEQYNGTVGDNIFLGTNILKSNKKDYCIDLIQTIPTIKVEYIEKERTLLSSGIENVIVL